MAARRRRHPAHSWRAAHAVHHRGGASDGHRRRRKTHVPGTTIGIHHPFYSQAQHRLFWANLRLRKWARAKSHATGEYSAITKVLHRSPAYRALPERERHGVGYGYGTAGGGHTAAGRAHVRRSMPTSRRRRTRA